MKTETAVLRDTTQPLSIEELDVPQLKPGQVLVKISYSGVCHTQLSECRGRRGPDAFLPHCLGHEGSGIVVDVGPSVTKVKNGQRVLLSWMKGSGADVPGTIYGSALGNVNSGAITTFGRFSVISENRLTVLPDTISLKDAALLGCAVPTGIGAVMNTAQAQSGQSVVVFGAGGIGLCAVVGAAIAGCDPIVAVDVNPVKLTAATQVGATHTINAGDPDFVTNLKQITKSGFDVAVEATGRKEPMELALQVVRNQGGRAVILGNAVFGEKISIDPREFNAGKQLRGSWGGDNNPDRDFPKYFDYLQAGKLQLAPFQASVYSLSQVNQALDDLESGKVVRPLLDMETN